MANLSAPALAATQGTKATLAYTLTNWTGSSPTPTPQTPLSGKSSAPALAATQGTKDTRAYTLYPPAVVAAAARLRTLLGVGT